MKHKILVFSIVIISCSFAASTHAQEGINFFKGSYNEALEQAEKENKMLFVDFFTTWCGPCKQMERDIFPLKEVGDYFNEKYISVQLNAEAEENAEWVSKFKINLFPSLAFIRPDGELALLRTGLLMGDDLVDAAKIALGEKMSFEELYSKYRADNKNLNIQQQLLMEAPDFIAMQEGIEADKWISRISRIYRSYVKEKMGPNLINANDYRIILMYHEKKTKNDEMIEFINTNLAAWKEEIGNAPAYFVIDYNDTMMDKFAKEGSESYKEYLEKIKNDFKEAYSVIEYDNLSPYDRAKMYYDAVYTIYKKKDDNAYVEMMNEYLQKLGAQATPANYGEAAQTLYYATDGKISDANHRQAIEWLQKALEKEDGVLVDRINMFTMMGDSYKALKEYDKTTECYNHAYLLSLQMDDMQMMQRGIQMAIKAKLADLELLRK